MMYNGGRSTAAIFVMKWTYEICAEAALRFRSKQEFRDTENSKFQWLLRAGRLDEACAHMVRLHRSLSDEDIAQIAAGFTHRRAFKLGDQSAYKAAIKRGILDRVCEHMDVKYRIQTDAEIAAIARQFKSRSEFVRKDNGAYQVATKRGILDAACEHMVDSRATRRLSNDELLAISRTYRTRNDFKLGDFGAYTTVLRRPSIVESAFEHMEVGETGFREDLPAVLYQFRLHRPNGQVLYKVGITNRKPRQRKITMGIQRGIKSELTHAVQFARGRDARIAEKFLHRHFASKRYDGDPVMANGNTEVFTVALLGT